MEFTIHDPGTLTTNFRRPTLTVCCLKNLPLSQFEARSRVATRQIPVQDVVKRAAARAGYDPSTLAGHGLRGKEERWLMPDKRLPFISLTGGRLCNYPCSHVGPHGAITRAVCGSQRLTAAQAKPPEAQGFLRKLLILHGFMWWRWTE